MRSTASDYCGPPPPYKEEADNELSQQGDQGSFKKTKDSDPQMTIPTWDGPPPYSVQKQNVSLPTSSFAYIQPTVLRSWKRFLCSCNKCSISMDNLAYNLWYFQLNYISVLLAVIVSAVFFINNCDFNICILVTTLVMLLLYITHKYGCIPKLLGRHLSLLEEMIAVIMFAIPSYGIIIPGTAPVTFMFFLALFAAFTIAHACTSSPVQRSWIYIHQVHEV